MSDDFKKSVKEKYARQLNKGERFWPDSIFKDAIVSFGLFVLLVLMATFVGVAGEPKADPSDTAYIPRPEWYFLFLFKFLALYGQIPLLGKIEWLATVVVPGIAVLVLLLMPFIDRSPARYYGKRALPLTVMGLFVVSIVTLTLMADVPTGATLVGTLQTLAGLVVPGVALILLFLMSFAFKNTPAKTLIWTAVIAGVLMVGLTVSVLALAPAPAQAEEVVAGTLAEQITTGGDLYAVNCVECHGDDGKVTTITGVKGLDGKQIIPINSNDVLYTLDDAALAQTIAYGRPDSGMTPFGKAYGGQLSKSQIDYIVTYMRYTWDNRFEAPPLKPLYPPLAAGEIPSYDVHIAPIVQRYCISCHRQGKDNRDFWMDSYDNILKTGDEAPNVVAGDPKSILLQVIQQHEYNDPQSGQKLVGVMPPNKALKPEIIEVFVRWIMAGMPKTAADAAALPTLTPAPTPTP